MILKAALIPLRVTHAHYFSLITLAFGMNLVGIVYAYNQVPYAELITMVCGAIPFLFGIYGIFSVQRDLDGFYSNQQNPKFAKVFKCGCLLSLVALTIVMYVSFGY